LYCLKKYLCNFFDLHELSIIKVMKYPRGSSIAVGLVVGLVIGILTDNIVSMLFLGLMFGGIGEGLNKPKKGK